MNAFLPPNVTQAARQLGAVRIARERARIRAQCDAMREAMGMEPAQWPR